MPEPHENFCGSDMRHNITDHLKLYSRDVTKIQISKECFEAGLNWLDRDNRTPITNENVNSLIEFGLHFKLPGLIKECDQVYSKSVKPNSPSQWYEQLKFCHQNNMHQSLDALKKIEIDFTDLSWMNEQDIPAFLNLMKQTQMLNSMPAIDEGIQKKISAGGIQDLISLYKTLEEYDCYNSMDPCSEAISLKINSIDLTTDSGASELYSLAGKIKRAGMENSVRLPKIKIQCESGQDIELNFPFVFYHSKVLRAMMIDLSNGKTISEFDFETPIPLQCKVGPFLSFKKWLHDQDNQKPNVDNNNWKNLIEIANYLDVVALKHRCEDVALQDTSLTVDQMKDKLRDLFLVGKHCDSEKILSYAKTTLISFDKQKLIDKQSWVNFFLENGMGKHIPQEFLEK